MTEAYDNESARYDMHTAAASCPRCGTGTFWIAVANDLKLQTVHHEGVMADSCGCHLAPEVLERMANRAARAVARKLALIS